MKVCNSAHERARVRRGPGETRGAAGDGALRIKV